MIDHLPGTVHSYGPCSARAGAALLVVWALAGRATADPATQPSPAPPSAGRALVLKLNDEFPKTKHWFEQAASIRFIRAANGFTPDWDTITHPRVLRVDSAGQRLAPVLPFTADGGMVIAIDGLPDFWVRATALDAKPVPGEAEAGLVSYPGAYGRSDLLYKLTPTHVDEYVYVPDARAPHVFRYKLETGPGVGEVHATATMIEFYDTAGNARLRLERPFARDAAGVRRDGTLELTGDVLTSRVDLSGLTFPVLIDPDWTTTGRLVKERFLFTAAALPGGEVFAPGGCTLVACPQGLGMPRCSSVLAMSERYTPSSGTWRQAAVMMRQRFAYAGASLPTGDFLVAGGCTEPQCTGTTAEAEVYLHEDNAWIPVPSLPSPAAFVTATRLPGGDVLVAGGCDTTGCTTAAVIFEADTRTWRTAASMATARGLHTATALADGRVLVTGGCTNLGCTTVLDSVELYNPVSDSWTTAAPMPARRAGHTATALIEGDVIVAGGCAGAACDPTLQTADRWSRSTSAWVPAPSMMEPRHDHTAALLADGTVLVTGGCFRNGMCTSGTEVYDPYLHTWTQVGRLATERGYHASVMLEDGRYLVTGGCNSSTCIPWSEIYPQAVERPDAGPGVPDGAPYVPPDAGMPSPPGPCDCRAGGRAGGGAGTGVALGILAAVATLARRRVRRDPMV